MALYDRHKHDSRPGFMEVDQVDPIMNHPFELSDTERADAVKKVTFVVPN